MKSTRRANLMLHISSVIYGLLGLAAFAVGFLLPREDGGLVGKVMLIGSGVLSVGIIAVIEAVAAGLRKGKKWAWIGGLIIFATYVPSLFLPLGIIGLIALLSKESRETYGMETAYQSWAGSSSESQMPPETTTAVEPMPPVQEPATPKPKAKSITRKKAVSIRKQTKKKA